MFTPEPMNKTTSNPNPPGRPRPRTKEDRPVSTRTRTTRRGRTLSLALAALVAASSLAVGGVPGGPSPASAGVSPPSATNHDFGEPIYSADARGDLITIGNATTGCSDYTGGSWTSQESITACLLTGAGAAEIRDGNGNLRPPINNYMPMDFVDLDSDGSTFQSTPATLDIPAGSTVLWAGLHWNAATNVPNPTLARNGSTWEDPPLSNADRFDVRFKTPGSGVYTDMTADDTWDDNQAAGGGTTSYGGYIDVTDMVTAAGEGVYWLADVQSCQGFGGCFGSWSMTVAYANEAEPARNLNVWHGWQLTAPNVNGGVQDFTVTGLTPPPTGSVNAKIGVVQADGDRNSGPDSLEISSPSAPWTPFTTPLNPATDFFRSVISTGQPGLNPAFVYNLNTDIALVSRDDIVSNTDDQFSFRVRTANSEFLYSQVVHSAVDIYEPEIGVDKTVTPDKDLAQGDEVTWSLDVTNAGVDTIRNAVVTDPLPAGVTYVPGSVEFVSGGPADILGAKTDAAGDDQVDYDPATRQFTFRVGAGADGTTGGTMGVAPAADGSDQVLITFKTTVDVGPGQTVTNTAHAYGEGRELEDPYGPLVTEDDDPATAGVGLLPNLVLDKTTDGASFTPGSTHTYGISVTNNGGGIARNVVVEDELREGLSFVSASNGGTATGQDVSWNLGDLAPGQTVNLTVDVKVARPAPAGLIDETGTVPNTATVHADNDCIPGTGDPECTDKVENPVDAPHLTQDKVVDKAEALPADKLTYTVTVGNDGKADATKVMATDTLPEGVTFDEAVPAQGTVTDNEDGTLTWDIGTLAPGASTTMKVTATINEGQWDATLENRVIATNDPGDCVGETCDPPTVKNPCTDDADYSCAETKTPAPGLRQDKVVDKAEAKAGEELTYKVTVANTGETTYTDLPAVDELPKEVTFVSASDGGVHKDGKVSWTIDKLAPGEKVVYTVKAKVNAGVVSTSFINKFKVTPPDGYPPADVDHKCSDDATKSCAPTKVPADPPPSSGGGGGGRLPLTGANSLALAGIGAALVGGGVLALRLRRRTAGAA
jgi:uncharacterized repeat protein (TIGR01451 family)/LPXTG-motif cell wall-anchored protein